MMDIREIRKAMKVSQEVFAREFGIPVGTIRNWEQGISKPPSYVYNMILASMRRDYMINFETVRFINMLNELANLSKGGIAPFSEATRDNFHCKIFYDERTFDDGRYKIVGESCIDHQHHDVVSYYDCWSSEFSAFVEMGLDYDEKTDKDIEKPYVTVQLRKSMSSFGIEDGEWFFCE